VMMTSWTWLSLNPDDVIRMNFAFCCSSWMVFALVPIPAFIPRSVAGHYPKGRPGKEPYLNPSEPAWFAFHIPWKYRSLLLPSWPLWIHAPINLVTPPLIEHHLPGLSSVPANKFPIMTERAPRRWPCNISGEFNSTVCDHGNFVSSETSDVSIMAESWGIPTPAMTVSCKSIRARRPL